VDRTVTLTPELKKQFDDWKAKANRVGLFATAKKYGAKLKRTGREHVGPCPQCKGVDRFSVNEGKGAWNCRGSEGGHDSVGLLMHIQRMSFMEACEELSGEPPPRGKSKPISDEERRKREDDQKRYEKEKRENEADEERRRARRVQTAAEIWSACKPIAGTLAEKYLMGRGLLVPPGGWPDVIGFHPGLEWETGAEWDGGRKVKAGPVFPALVGRVQDVCGDTVAIWRIFLDPQTGGKAPVENPKLGLGNAAGGAIRIGGVARKIGAAEGVETALAAWALVNFRYPVWSLLSTSGMMNVEIPLEVEEIVIFPDGDQPVRKQDGEYIPEPNPPGIKAARTLAERVKPLGIACSIQAEPAPGTDYLDIYNSIQGMVTA
jgi:hypothetical protein